MTQMTQMTQPRAEVSMMSQSPTMKIPATKISATKIQNLIKNLRAIVAAGPIGSGEIAEIQNLVRSSLADMRAIGLDTKHDGPGRYLLYKDQDFGFVIMMLVWGQGDKTPIHDHGTWGVEAVLKNTIAVTSYTQCDVDPEEIADEAYATPARPILSRAIAGALGDVAGGEWRQGGGMGEPHGGR